MLVEEVGGPRKDRIGPSINIGIICRRRYRVLVDKGISDEHVRNHIVQFFDIH